MRNLIKHKVYSLINISGLAVGMALCILVIVYVQDVLSYDTHHQHSHRIYRIAQLENQTGRMLHYMRIGGGISTRLKTDFPDAVEKRVRLFSLGQVWTKIGDRLFHEKRTYLADETFFEIFSFPFINGNPKKALKEPNAVVITETTALKYFSSTDVVGKMVKVDVPGAPLLKISGVIKDAPRNFPRPSRRPTGKSKHRGGSSGRGLLLYRNNANENQGRPKFFKRIPFRCPGRLPGQ